jgi:acyl carrier protein
MTIRRLLTCAAFGIFVGCMLTLATPPAHAADCAAPVSQLLAKQLEVDIQKVVPTASLVDDLGLDELDVVEVRMALQLEFEIELTDERLAEFKTVGQVSSFVSRYAKKTSSCK